MDLHFKWIQCYIKMVLQKIFGGVWKTLKVVETFEALTEKFMWDSSLLGPLHHCCDQSSVQVPLQCKLCILNTKPWDNPICRKINFWQNSAAVLERYMNRYSYFFRVYTFNSAIWYVNTSVLNRILKSFPCVYKILCNLNVMEFTDNI